MTHFLTTFHFIQVRSFLNIHSDCINKSKTGATVWIGFYQVSMNWFLPRNLDIKSPFGPLFFILDHPLSSICPAAGLQPSTSVHFWIFEWSIVRFGRSEFVHYVGDPSIRPTLYLRPPVVNNLGSASKSVHETDMDVWMGRRSAEGRLRPRRPGLNHLVVSSRSEYKRKLKYAYSGHTLRRACQSTIKSTVTPIKISHCPLAHDE